MVTDAENGVGLIVGCISVSEIQTETRTRQFTDERIRLSDLFFVAFFTSEVRQTVPVRNKNGQATTDELTKTAKVATSSPPRICATTKSTHSRQLERGEAPK